MNMERLNCDRGTANLRQLISWKKWYAPMLNSTVAKRLDVTKDLMILTIAPDAGVPKFLPGQYVAIGLPGSAPRYEMGPEEKEVHAPDKLIKRAYSIGSAPDDGKHLEFYIAIVPDGALTSRLATIREGDRLYVAPKITGTFTLDGLPADHNLALVSTGTGIAPFISMLRCPNTWTPGRKIVVAHGVRLPEDLAYRDELEQYAANRAGFKYLPIVSRAEPSYQGTKGRVTSLFDDQSITLNPETDHVYLCGNPAMIDELETRLTLNGYSVHSKKNPGKLHLEKYW